MIGKTISHYRVTHQLGAGGMGVVYGAEDDRLGRQVALKFIPEDMVRDRQAIERFRVEARTTSALNHPNICTVYDIGEHEGQPFIVMEWMKGQTLHDRLSSGMLKVTQIVDFGIEIADALDAAHEQGIVHRDIKPANIFVTERGHVKVMDFGLAKLLSNEDAMQAQTRGVEALTQPGMALGTSSYMSPEQAAGDTLDGRSDLFSLGIVLYECATGRRPFVGNSARAVLSAILHTAPMAPGLFNEDLPVRLQQVISDCLEKEPDLRYQNAASLRADLKRVKRDLESGRTASITPPADSRATAASSRTGFAESVTAPGVHASDPTVTIRQPVSNPTPAKRRLASFAIPAVIAIVVVAAAVGYFRLTAVSEAPTTNVAPPSSAALVQSRSEAAERSLQAKQYRDAQRYADEVLAIAPSNARAAAIREQAVAQLGQADVSLERARKMIQAGDVRGAVRALDDARTIDPFAPGLIEVSQVMADRFKAQAEAAELELQRSRAAAPAQRAAASPAPPPSPPPTTSAATPQTPVEPTRESSVPTAPPIPAAVPAPVVESPKRSEPTESAAVKPAPSPVASERKPAAEAGREADDDAAIRAVVAAYARAIESKDLALFRSIKPNLGTEEERRIQQGFRAVTSQKVNITITSIDRAADSASVQLRRQDVIEAGGRRQSSESRQTMTLTKSKGAWVIVEIGR